jgi:hypothetical protein
MAFFTRYRIQPAMSHLREPIYESHHLHFSLRRPGKSCKRVSIDAAVIVRARFAWDDTADSRAVVRLFDTIVGLLTGRERTHRASRAIRSPCAATASTSHLANDVIEK